MAGLEPVDAVEVTLVVDNFVDVLLAGAEGVRRSSILYDGGMTPSGLGNNLEVRCWSPARSPGSPSSRPASPSTTPGPATAGSSTR